MSPEKPLTQIIYLVALAMCGLYLFVINYLLQPLSWRQWFLNEVPVEIAIVNVFVLALLFFSLTLFSGRLPVPIRMAALLLLLVLGSFFKVSIDVAPLPSWTIIGIAVVVYFVMKRRSERGSTAV